MVVLALSILSMVLAIFALVRLLQAVRALKKAAKDARGAANNAQRAYEMVLKSISGAEEDDDYLNSLICDIEPDDMPKKINLQ